MRNVFAKLWADDNGIVAMEYLLVATFVGIGVIAGLNAVGVAVSSELAEVASAVLSLNQSYDSSTVDIHGSPSGNHIASTVGSGAQDSPSKLTTTFPVQVGQTISMNP